MRKKLYIVRREAGGIGGAEKVANKFAEAFSEHFDTHLISAGSTINDIQIKGTSGPSWWKCLKFAISSNQFIKKNPNSLILSMERGVPGAIYRAWDGVHKVWIKHKYGSSRKWNFNPLHWTLPLLEKHSIEESTTIVPNSQMVKQHILDHYDVPTDKLKVIYNGYDSNIYYPLSFSQRKSLRQKLHIDNNDLKFIPNEMSRELLTSIVNVTPQNLREKLNALVLNKNKLMEIAQLDLYYSNKWHTPTSVAKLVPHYIQN